MTATQGASNSQDDGSARAELGAWTAWLIKRQEGVRLLELRWLPSGTRAGIAALYHERADDHTESRVRGDALIGIVDGPSGAAFEFGVEGQWLDRLQRRADAALAAVVGSERNKIVALGVSGETSEMTADWIGSLIGALAVATGETPERQLSEALAKSVSQWRAAKIYRSED